MEASGSPMQKSVLQQKAVEVEETSPLSGKRFFFVGIVFLTVLSVCWLTVVERTVANKGRRSMASRAATPRAHHFDTAMVRPWVEPADWGPSEIPGYIRHDRMDVAPGNGEIKELEGLCKNVTDCATVCDQWQVQGVHGCQGFVVHDSRQKEDEMRCFFKSVHYVGLYRNSEHVRSYFRPARFVKSVPRLPIVYGVLTAKKFLRTRLWTAYETWLHDVESVVFLEDAEDVRKEFDAVVADMKASDHLKNVVTTAAFITEPVDKTQRSFNGAWKNLPILKHLAKSHPDSPWYAMVDDDSFIAQHNMNILVSSSYRHQAQMYYLGAVFGSGGPDGFPFQQGGAGILYNNVAMKQFMGHYDACLAKCKEWAGDIRLGCCARISRVPLTADGAFWSQTIFHSLVRDARHRMSPFPVSFHNMRNQTWVQDLHQALDIIGGDDEARGGKLAASCNVEYLSTTSTCLRFRQHKERMETKSATPVRIGEAPVAFSWGGSGSGNITTLVPAVPITWDFLDAQFRIGWQEKYGGEDEKLYRKPKLF